MGHPDPQVVGVDVRRGQAGVACQLRGGVAPLVVGEPVAAGEDRGIFAVGPLLDLLQTAGSSACCKSAGSFLWYQAAAAYEGR